LGYRWCQYLTLAYAGATYIAVQREPSDLSQRKVRVRPHLGHVEDVPFVVLGLFGIHDLDEHVPHRVIAALNGLVHVLHQVVGVFARQLGGLFSGEVLDADGGLDVEFDVFEGAILRY
jgi:hypothetical protein